jgi:hypothetical protein
MAYTVHIFKKAIRLHYVYVLANKCRLQEVLEVPAVLLETRLHPATHIPGHAPQDVGGDALHSIGDIVS